MATNGHQVVIKLPFMVTIDHLMMVPLLAPFGGTHCGHPLLAAVVGTWTLIRAPESHGYLLAIH